MIETWAVVFATLMGPVLAVQAQKWIERRREVTNRRSYVFQTLMATRAARMDQEHVRALNMIDLAFYGTRVFGRPRRNGACQAVIDAWREYHDHLAQPVPAPHEQARWDAMIEVRDNLFISLLSALANERGLEFDRVHLKRGAYHPNGYINLEQEVAGLRALAKQVLAGESALRIQMYEEHDASAASPGPTPAEGAMEDSGGGAAVHAATPQA